MRIEIYFLHSKDLPANSVLYREIPPGADVNQFSRPPDLVFYVRLKPGYTLPEGYGPKWYVLVYDPLNQKQ